jgi:hypothetical protein
MGTTVNSAVRKVLAVAARYSSNQDVVINMQERLVSGMWHDGKAKLSTNRGGSTTHLSQLIKPDDEVYAPYRRLRCLPQYEICHGWDMDQKEWKQSDAKLVQVFQSWMTKAPCVQVRDWFVTRDHDIIKIRTRQFIDGPFRVVKRLMIAQCRHVQRQCASGGFSVLRCKFELEKVHGIWPLRSPLVVNSSNPDKLTEFKDILGKVESCQLTVENPMLSTGGWCSAKQRSYPKA